MGRHKENDPMGDAIRELRAAIDRLYDAALKPMPQPSARFGHDCAANYSAIRDAYGFGNAHDGYNAGSLLHAFKRTAMPQERWGEGAGPGSWPMWEAFAGKVPDDIIYPEAGKDYATYKRRTQHEFASGAPVLGEGPPELSKVFTQSLTPALVQAMADAYLTPMKYAALRFVRWATDAVDRYQTTYMPLGRFNATKGKPVTLLVTMAGITRFHTVAGAPGELLAQLLRRGTGVAKADQKLYLTGAVPELAPFIRHVTKPRQKHNQNTKTTYTLEPAIRKRFKPTKDARKLKVSDG